jgi:hypothetical protein
MISFHGNAKRFKIQFIQTLIVISFPFIAFDKLIAQIAVMGGANYCDVRDNNLLENQKAIVRYQFGISFLYHPFKNMHSISIQNELLLNKKGYQQNLDKNYRFHFNYFSLPVLLNYAPVKNFSINSGVEFSGLFSTNVRQGTKTYHRFDTGLILGFTCLNSKIISFYARATYGLIPLLNYNSFDKLGNFTGEIHDLRNTCFSIGIKIKIFNEEIHLYE